MSFIDVAMLVACLCASITGAIRRRYADLPLLVGVFLRFAIAMRYSFSGDPDPDGYGMLASYYASLPLLETIVAMPKGAYWYSWLVSFAYRAFAESEIMIRFMNAAMSCWAVFITCDLSEHLYGQRVARRVAVFLSLFPSLIRFSSSFASRETLFVFLVIVSVRHMLTYYERGSLLHAFLGLVAVLCACIVHTSAVLFFALFLFLVVDKSSLDAGMRLLMGTLGTVGVAAIGLLLVRNGIGVEKLYLDRGENLLETANWISNASAEGRAAYLVGAQSSNPLMFVMLLPVRMAFFLYAPFVWMIRTGLDVLGCFDGLLYLWTTISCVSHARSILGRQMLSVQDKFVFCLAVILVGLIMMFSVGTSNYGTALRHRAKLIMLISLVAGPCMLKRAMPGEGSRYA